MPTKRLTRIAMLTAIALTIFMIEAQIPALVPIPGIKLGLANIVTVFAVFLLGPADTFCILLCRVLLGSFFAGQLMTLFYSLGGGLLCYLIMLVLRKIVTPQQIWVCSVLGAIAHNVGQICVAIVVTKTPALIAYLPILLISGIVAGIFTGLCAQFLANRIGRIQPKPAISEAQSQRTHSPGTAAPNQTVDLGSITTV